MAQFVLVHLTMSGNTRKIAELIAEGARGHDVEVSVLDVRDATPETVKNADAVGFGCSTYEHRMLTPMEKFLDRLGEDITLGKPGVAFGSYGWSGESAVKIAEKMRSAGFSVADPVLRIQYGPDEKESESCRLLGRDIAVKIKKAKKAAVSA